METRRIFFHNVGTIDLFITLRPENGRLHIHLLDDDDGIAVPVARGGLVSFDVTPEIETCIHDGKLEFTIHGDYHWIKAVGVRPPLKSLPQGPLFELEALFEQQ